MNSIFYGTDLRVGMFIHTIDGETFETFEEGRKMIQASIADSPCTTILVDTAPSTGTVYTICSRDNKMRSTFLSRQTPGAMETTVHVPRYSTILLYWTLDVDV